MTFSAGPLVLAAFLSGAVASVFIMLVIGVRRGDRAHHLADEPGTHLDALTRGVLGVGVRTCRTAGITAPKENDQCILLTGAIAPCRQSREITSTAQQAMSWQSER